MLKSFFPDSFHSNGEADVRDLPFPDLDRELLLDEYQSDHPETWYDPLPY